MQVSAPAIDRIEVSPRQFTFLRLIMHHRAAPEGEMQSAALPRHIDSRGMCLFPGIRQRENRRLECGQLRQDERPRPSLVQLHRQRLAVRTGELPVGPARFWELKTDRCVESVVVAGVYTNGMVRSLRLANRQRK